MSSEKNPIFTMLEHLSGRLEDLFERQDKLDERTFKKFDSLSEQLHILDNKMSVNTEITNGNCGDLQDLKKTYDQINETLDKNTVALVEHVRRTNLLEQTMNHQDQKITDVSARVTTIETDKTKKSGAVTLLINMGKGIVGIGIVLSLIYTAVQLIQAFK